MTEKFLKTTRFTNAHCSRFGPLPLLTNLAGTPPGTNYPLSGSDGYHDKVGPPPLSIASDTRHSSHRRPHQCRTLARSPVPRTQSPACSSARDVTQLHIKGVLPLSFPQEIIHPPLRTAFRVNNATTHRVKTLNSLMIRLRVGGAGSFPAILLSVAMCVVADATAILSCCCLVNLSYAILVGVVFIYCFTS